MRLWRALAMCCSSSSLGEVLAEELLRAKGHEALLTRQLLQRIVGNDEALVRGVLHMQFDRQDRLRVYHVWNSMLPESSAVQLVHVFDCA